MVYPKRGAYGKFTGENQGLQTHSTTTTTSGLRLELAKSSTRYISILLRNYLTVQIKLVLLFPILRNAIRGCATIYVTYFHTLPASCEVLTFPSFLRCSRIVQSKHDSTTLVLRCDVKMALLHLNLLFPFHSHSRAIFTNCEQ
jgi:hypothetical protein